MSGILGAERWGLLLFGHPQNPVDEHLPNQRPTPSDTSSFSMHLQHLHSPHRGASGSLCTVCAFVAFPPSTARATTTREFLILRQPPCQSDSRMTRAQHRSPWPQRSYGRSFSKGGPGHLGLRTTYDTSLALWQRSRIVLTSLSALRSVHA